MIAFFPQDYHTIAKYTGNTDPETETQLLFAPG